MGSRAIVFLAHGSRDPLWQAPMEAIAARARSLEPLAAVRLAYLELCPPAIDDVVAELVAEGVLRIAVMPLFLGMGRHAREDLPNAVAALGLRHPTVAFDLLPMLGEDPALVELAARRAVEAAMSMTPTTPAR